MRVIDASAAIEWVLPGRDAAVERRASVPSGESLHSPEIIDLEVANVLRRLVSSRRLDSRAAAAAYVALAAALGCPLVTKDAKLARAASAAVPVELLGQI